MKMNVKPLESLENIAQMIADNGAAADATDIFSKDNYQLLAENRLFSAMIPVEHGGGGMAYGDMAALLRRLAQCHPSTALSFSMHQHIIAANVFKDKKGQGGGPMLQKVAANELKLVSTGAGDWLASNGEMVKVDGGYQYAAIKHFASGSPAGDLLVTSGPYLDPEEGWQVLHFPVSLKAEGVTVLDNWTPMGMRGSGSNSVQLEKVFVPDGSIVTRRPRGDFHGVYCVVLPVALPLIMSVYLGIAETAAEKARTFCNNSQDPVTPYIIGEMENALTTARVITEDMVRCIDGFDFEASVDTVNEIVKRKTVVAAACKTVASKAVESCGGPGFMRGFGLESLLRDTMASHFHPLQEKRQLLFTGSVALGQEPPGQAF
ncbi:acyl-CoA/acyl-ACP dehydrogenase [Pseudomaricurvus alkylphenolicus]|uniref:acyl-CoA dehydrogenase family protein n=1 Tax=Pseudomaricurvus alkylphenolicus TaxID=1306991 RepID=UPI0014239615|nr:acyl-CoA dehydrogenase family protein [Pseudomaricurvus alkylphenolicus]NIB44700.1 acyl-CoA/acyl-ACP dehydrogenase [Pseudomaricurvus alkylphenolicus]